MANSEQNLPVHVGIIMDGNGRWAKKRGLPRNVGHKQGADVFGKIARHAAKRGIRHLTVYAFSTENWRRPPEEVAGIMSLLRNYLSDVEKYTRDNMCMRILGERDALDADIREQMTDIERRSRDNTGMVLNIAFNYGGRDEILRAAKELARRYLKGEVPHLEDVDEKAFGELLYTAGQPDTDLIIRTSGEYRTSNFLPWQGAYAEYVFSDALWPDFTPKLFDQALVQYAERTRRMGGV